MTGARTWLALLTAACLIAALVSSGSMRQILGAIFLACVVALVLNDQYGDGT